MASRPQLLTQPAAILSKSDRPLRLFGRCTGDFGLLRRRRYGMETTERGARSRKGETDLSYCAEMYYTAAVLLGVAGVFADLSHDYGVAEIWFIQGIALFGFRLVTPSIRGLHSKSL